jgi:hypothetical protein
MDLSILKSQNLIAFLEKYGHAFDGDKTLCPFHDDHQESMSVNLKDGSWLWYCHACRKGGTIIDYIMAKENISKKEAIDKLAIEFGLKNEKLKPAVVDEYSYIDEEGKELFRVVRFKPKDFKVKHEVNGQWVWDKKGIREVLYNLPQIIKAEEVWLVEGEKDADNVQKLGLMATTAPFGMGHWKAEFSEKLKGKIVNVCMDRGAEAEAERRARDIARVAKEVRIIELPGLTKEGEDISDWIERHDSQSTEDLRTQIEKIANEMPVFELPSDELKIHNDFLELYIDSISRVTDAPKIFILFSGLGLLSGVLSKFYFYYPRLTPLNLYLLLLAPSTFYRKSVTIDIATDYLNAVNPALLFPESFTSEALLEILSKQNRGLLTWRELIQVKEFQFGSEYNRGLPSLLTDLFDFKPRIRRYTKGEGEYIIENPILSILAAGISTWLVENLKKIDFQGGIWTRFLFVPIEEDEGRKFNLPKEFMINPDLESRLKRLDALEPQKMDLARIYPLLEKWGTKHQAQTLRLNNDLLRANFQRLEVALIKIACLLQLAENESTIVEPQTFNEAVKIVEYLKRILPPFFEEEVVFTEFEKNRIRILKFLKKEKETKQNELRRYSHLEGKVLDKILEQLMAEDAIGFRLSLDSIRPGRKAKIYFYKGE